MTDKSTLATRSIELARHCWTRHRTEVLVALFSLMVIGVVWVVTVERVRYEYRDTVASVARQNSNLALAFEQHTIRTLKGVDQALAQIAHGYLQAGPKLDIKDLVKFGTVDAGLFHNIVINDERGDSVVALYDFGSISGADREYFRVHQQGSATGMFIGRPAIGRGSGKWSIHMSRRIDRPDGSFGGVVFAAVDPHYFTSIYQRFDLGRGGVVFLVGLDGVARARRVDGVATFGQDMSKSSVLAAQAKSPHGNFVSVGRLEGISRLISYRTLAEYPMVVAVGASHDFALSETGARERAYYLGSFLATLLILAFAGTLIVAQSRQRRTHIALAGSEARLRATFNQAAVGIVRVSLEGRFLEVNAKLCEMLGYTERELKLLTFSDVTHPEDRAHAGALKKQLLSSGGDILSDTIEKRYIHKNGAVLWATLSAALVRDEQGNPDYFVSFIQDISMRKEAEESLRRNTERLERAQRVGRVGDWSYDLKTGAITWSEQIYRMFGRDPRSGPPAFAEFLTMLTPDSAQLLQERVHAAIETGKAQHYELWMKLPDGTLGYQQTHLEVDRDAEGRVSRLYGTAHDITEHRQAEEQLRLSAKAFESIADGVVVTDAKRRIVSVNPAFSSITGYSLEEALGKSPKFLQSGRHDAAYYAAMWEEIARAGSWRGEVWDRRKNGEIYPELLSISAVKDASGTTTHYVGVCTDISSLKRYEARLHHQAHHDALTGLPNRTLFQDRFAETLSRARRHDHLAAVLFLDLDRFKTINDSLGHAVGDLLLQAVAERLTANVREVDTVARFGGDEFAVLLDIIEDSQNAGHVAQKLIDAMAHPFKLGGHELYISVSIGIGCYPQDGADTASLFKNADTAMYRAKAEGRNNYQFFSIEMNARALENLQMSNHLRLALERNELLLHYQPCVDLKSGRFSSAEALIRWNHPELGSISPARFIPLAEESGMIEPIGDWVLKTACAQMRAWRDAGLPLRRIAVNLSARQFRHPDLVQRISATLKEAGLPAHHLELEVTESMVMQNPEAAAEVLRQLKAMGISIAIDDFGTGYSSLSYLKRFPIDFLKIDRSFVSGVQESADDAAITKAIIALAKSLNLRLIAEGVETREQRAFLEKHDCDEGQGYLFSKPVPATDIERMLLHAAIPPAAAGLVAA